MKTPKSYYRKLLENTLALGLLFIFFLLPQNIFAHCDSYDGPVIQDAFKAIEHKNVELVLKWVEVKYEDEITDLFHKTLKYEKQGGEVYGLVQQHFLETLVRLHREGEGAPYTGLKPAGSTLQIIGMTDAALETEDIDAFLEKFNGHLERVVREKYEKVARLKKTKDKSVALGRAYVEAYVDYTHTVEALHAILEHGGGHNH